jgi:hypothetical protein
MGRIEIPQGGNAAGSTGWRRPFDGQAQDVRFYAACMKLEERQNGQQKAATSEE